MRDRAVIDLRAKGLLDELLTDAGHKLGTSLDPVTARIGGEDGATGGAVSDRGTWVRLQHRPANTDPPPRWHAEETAAELTGVRKPTWHRAVTWDDTTRGVWWRADELDHVTAPVVGSITAPPETCPPDWWWHQLRANLDALRHHSTDRVALSQHELDCEIAEIADNELDTHVPEWAPAHGDLCWPNITTDGQLLDWEAWGLAPRGYDAATLWGLSLPHPDLAAQIQSTFADELSCRSGQLARLAWCASARHATRARADLAQYRDPIETAVHELLDSLRRPTT